MVFREGANPQVVVAMATFRRPELLRQALGGLTREASTLRPPADILVVDNDPAGSAAREADRWAGRGVRYVREPEPGIAAARNRALREACSADAIVFIDDDEVPAEGWLSHLVATWQRWDCAAVAGPVESDFIDPPDPWVLGVEIFRRKRLASGTLLRGAATNNLLLDVRQLRERDLMFDPRFGLSGGSDSMLTHRLSQLGGDIRWCDDALVRETVPADRTTRRWVRRRLLRTSNGWARVQVLLQATVADRLRTRVRIGFHALLVVARGSVRFGVGLLANRLALRCAGERDILNGLGVMLGAAGMVRFEYARPGNPRPSRAATR